MKKQLLLSLAMLLSVPAAMFADGTQSGADAGKKSCSPCQFKDVSMNNPLTQEIAARTLQTLLQNKARLQVKHVPVDVINTEDMVQVAAALYEKHKTDNNPAALVEAALKTYVREKLVQGASAVAHKAGVDQLVPEVVKKDSNTLYALNVAIKTIARHGVDIAITSAVESAKNALNKAK